MHQFHFLVTWPPIAGAIAPTLRVAQETVMTMTGERQSDAFRRMAAAINDTISDHVQMPSVLPWHGPIQMMS
jgi:hypothetical protein